MPSQQSPWQPSPSQGMTLLRSRQQSENGRLLKGDVAVSIPFIKMLQMAVYFYDHASPPASHAHEAEIEMLSSTSAVKQHAHRSCTCANSAASLRCWGDGRWGTAIQVLSWARCCMIPMQKVFAGFSKACACSVFAETWWELGVCLPLLFQHIVYIKESSSFKRNRPLGFLFFFFFFSSFTR